MSTTTEGSGGFKVRGGRTRYICQRCCLRIEGREINGRILAYDRASWNGKTESYTCPLCDGATAHRAAD